MAPLGRKIPAISVEDMRTVDKNISSFDIDILQLMENAGRTIAMLARDLLKRTEGRKICILAGRGNNGGDGFAAARFLHEWGASVSVVVPERYGNLHSLTRKHADSSRKAGANVLYPADSGKFPGKIKYADMVIDALLGYNIKGSPKGKYATLINLANSSRNQIIAVDCPSGLNVDTGEPYNPCIKATATLSLGLPKRGLLETSAMSYVGDLYVGDVGIPKAAYKKIGISVPNIFSDSSIVKMF